MHHFWNLFQTSGARNLSCVSCWVERRVDDHMNELLCKPISNIEVFKAVSELGALKALIPDGFPGLFYKNYWNVVGNKICEAIRSFFDGGQTLKDFNIINLILIPKVTCPEIISQVRLISVCNFLYKIISKTLANRLKLLMDSIISPDQLAFILGRAIHDNTIITNEVFHHLKIKGSSRAKEMALKIDINKAYDRVERDFLLEVMTRLGFYEKCVNMIYQCIISMSFNIVVTSEKRVRWSLRGSPAKRPHFSVSFPHGARCAIPQSV